MCAWPVCAALISQAGERVWILGMNFSMNSVLMTAHVDWILAINSHQICKLYGNLQIICKFASYIQICPETHVVWFSQLSFLGVWLSLTTHDTAESPDLLHNDNKEFLKTKMYSNKYNWQQFRDTGELRWCAVQRRSSCVHTIQTQWKMKYNDSLINDFCLHN